MTRTARRRTAAIAGSVLIGLLAFGSFATGQSSEPLPQEGLSGDDVRACFIILASQADALPSSKRQPLWDATTWWRHAESKLPAPIHEPTMSDVAARFTVGEIRKAADACMAVSKGKLAPQLAANTAKLMDGVKLAPVRAPVVAAAPPPPPPPPPVLTMSELFAVRLKAAEDMVDCYVAAGSMTNYASGKPDYQQWIDFYLVIGKATALPKLSTDEFRQRAIYTNKTLGEAAVTDIAQRCWRNYKGEPNNVNPYRAQLLGAERFSAFEAAQVQLKAAEASRREAQQAAAARAAEQARADESALAAQRDLYARCDTAASEGVDRARRKLQEAQRMTLNWVATGRGGTNYGWDAFEGGCRNIASTWKTMQNMDCPMEVAKHIQTLLDNYYLDTGGAVTYCKPEWQ
mgnify:CR=1 FL=1